MSDIRLPDERPLSRARFVATSRALRRLPRRRRPRWSLTLALAGALVLLSALAAVGYRAFQGDERFVGVECYERPSLDSPVNSFELGSGHAAIDECRTILDGDGSDTPLTACVNDLGYIAVFPAGGDICGRLDLIALADADPAVGTSSLGELDDALAARLDSWALDDRGDGCQETSAARDIVERALQDAAADDWTVAVKDGQADGVATCARAHFDVPRRTVALTPVAGPASDVMRILERLEELEQGAGDCLTREQQRALAQEALRDLGISDWRVPVDESYDWDAPGVCATLVIFERERTLTVTGDQ